MEKCKDLLELGGCKEELLEEFRGIRLSWSCKEICRRIVRYSIELGVVRRMLGEM